MPSEAPPSAPGPVVERRLHPVSLLFRVLGHARGFLLPAIVVYFASTGDRWQVWAAFLFVPIVAADVFRYLTLRWRYDADELVVREGWIFKNERHVPYARIQNVDLRQNVLHRAFKVAEVRIETAGGVEAEVSLSVVSLAAYEEIRERAFLSRRASSGRAPARTPTGNATDSPTAPGPDAVPSSSPETLVSLSATDVVLLGIHPGRGLALLAIAWGAIREMGFFEGWEERVENLAQSPAVPDFVIEIASVFFVVSGIVVLLLLSLAASFVEFWNYRLEADGDVFRVRRGLLTREVQSIPRGRIQVATVERPWFLGLTGRARVHVRTAGGFEGGDRRGGGRHFAPVVASERVPELLARIRPGLDVDAAEWRPLGRTAPRRFLVGALIPALVLGAVAVVFLEWIGAGIAAAFVAWAIVVARRRARRAGWARTPWGLLVREGAFSVTEHATFADKVQAVVLADNPLDRRHGHATVRVDTAGPFLRSSGTDVAIPYVPRAEAEALRADLVGAAARSRFRW